MKNSEVLLWVALSPEPQIWKFHVVVWQTASKNSTKKACNAYSTIIFPHSTDHGSD